MGADRKKEPTSALEEEKEKLQLTEEEKRHRFFMGRKEYFNKFKELMDQPQEKRKVWCVHGVGGIGKSWLLAELEERAKKEGFVTSRLDLEGISEPEDFFTALWDGLSEDDKRFFGKTKRKIKELEELKAARLKSEESALARRTKAVASGAIKVGAAAVDTVAPGVGTSGALAVEGAKYLVGELRRETDVQVEKLNKDMIAALYSDLQEGVQKGKFKAAFFLDTFERCNPAVVGSALAVLEYLNRSALIVVAGRESLLDYHLPKGVGWEALIERKTLKGLKKKEIREWLKPGAHAGTATDTKAGIVEQVAQGFPLLVTFVLETLGDKGIEELVEADWSEVEQKQQEFLEDRIIEVLEKLDEDTSHSLRLAAFPRRFDGTLFKRYWESYEKGISSGKVLKCLKKVKAYSFVEPHGKWFRCHAVIQSAVRRYLFENETDLWQRLNEFSFKYFSDSNELGPFREKIFHDYQLRPFESFEKFVGTHQELSKDEERWRIADILLEDFSSYCAEVSVEAKPDDIVNIYDGVDTLLFEYPRGDRSALCLRRIEILKSAERITTSPEQSADIQIALGNVWQQLPTGERAENIERAIGHYKKALEVYTREAFPEKWALTHNNLGVAYGDRIKGERGENIEKAIGHYENALEVRTREAFPIDWATTHNNLGVAYGDRIKGERAENIERAIGHYKKALEVRTREAFPADWAGTHNNLGIAYRNRIKGERVENLETAIGHHIKALEVYTSEAFPGDWAMTYNNLGAAYGDRIKGERAENIEKAIGHFEKALEVRTREAFPEQWAMTHNNLGIAYRNRIKGERVENLETAIGHHIKALEVYTSEAFPGDWAMTYNNLGAAYGDRIKGERAENIETAIGHYKNALEVRTREAFPIDFGETKHNLAVLFLEEDYPLPEGERLVIALGHLEEACEVFKPDDPIHKRTFELRDGLRKRLGKE